MQWPMTLSPTNEAISREIMQKNLFQEKNALILWGHIEDVRIVLLSKKCKIVLEKGV